MSKPFVSGFVIGLTLLFVCGVGASRLRQKDTKHRDLETEKYQTEVLDATPVRIGTLTAKQRIHSKISSHYSELTNNLPGDKTISETVAHSKSKIIERSVEIGVGELLTEPEAPEAYLGELARSSDLIIRGRVTKRASQITEDDTFLFTDYDVIIVEVFKNNAAAPIDAGKTIVVTRPGGKVVLDGVVVKATDSAYAALPINTNDVVVFLQFIPETGAYKTTRATGAFELEGLTVRPLTGVPFPPGVIRDSDSFLETIRAVSTK